MNGQAIRPERRTPEEVALVRALLKEAESAKDLATWRRAKSVLGYLDGQKVIALSEALEVTRGPSIAGSSGTKPWGPRGSGMPNDQGRHA
jgi:hypothetical protein